MKEWGELLLLLFLEAISNLPVRQAIKTISFASTYDRKHCAEKFTHVSMS